MKHATSRGERIDLSTLLPHGHQAPNRSLTSPHNLKETLTHPTVALKLNLSTREKRKAAFTKIGAALRDYYTGEDSQFEIKAKAIQDPALSSRMGGPQMKSQQFERTVRK